MQKPFASLLSDVLWYVHALDPIGVQKSDTTSRVFGIQIGDTNDLNGVPIDSAHISNVGELQQVLFGFAKKLLL